MILVNTPGSWKYVYPPFLHAKWHGCTATDVVFPGFLFVIGLAMSISFKKYDGKGWQALFLKVLKRSALIFGIGLLLNWFPFFHKNIENLRIFGVLQRIALSFFLASIFLLYSKKWKFISVVAIVLMLVHWAILYYFGNYAPYSLEGNISGAIDVWLVGDSHVYHGFGQAFDPEGILGVLTGAAQILLGYLIGYQITSQTVDKDTVTFLLIAGAVGLGVGYCWSHWLPINKPLWTGSYVLFTTGIMALVLCALIEMIDIKKKTKWTFLFQVFGLNPLISYVISGVIVRILLFVFKWEESNGYAWLYDNIFQPYLGDYPGSLAFALTMVGFVWLIAWGMWKKGIVVKV
jgi:predicted acyltransferase